MHGHGECGYVRREELRGDGADGAVGGGEICFQFAGFRVGEDDAGVAVEEFVDVVVFGDEHGSAPVEREEYLGHKSRGKVSSVRSGIHSE